MTNSVERKPPFGLDPAQALSLIQNGGVLSRFLKDFEPREQQQAMMSNVIAAYNSRHVALIEAGTGTGKSMAYLIPAILWAANHQERTVISTNTIALQEQLLHKDIPLLLKALNIDVKAVLVKGMGNYLCLRKLEDSLQELRLMTAEESEELEKIEMWSHSTQDGSRSDLRFVPSFNTWEKVCAESDMCGRQDCPYFQECHFFKARRKAEDANLLIVNHHLLFSDISKRSEDAELPSKNKESAGILPSYSRLIIDEAHHIEDVATEHFATSVSYLELMRTLSRLNSDKPKSATVKEESSHGMLPLLKEKLHSTYRRDAPRELASIHNCLTIDLAAFRHDLLLHASETFQVFANFIQQLRQPAEQTSDAVQGESKLRILPMHKTHPKWSEDIIPHTKRLLDALQKYFNTLESLEFNLKGLKDPKLDEQTKGVRSDISSFAMRLREMHDILQSFIDEKTSLLKVRWIEAKALRALDLVNIQLVSADLDISKLLSEFLFKQFATVVLCSATLTTNKQFNFYRSRLGIISELLPQRKITENIYDSPFNYSSQALFAIPKDMPNPLDPGFTQAVCEKIWQLVQASRGNAFVLFTSYSMLNTCYQQLSEKFKEHRFPLFRQGDDNRQALITKFKSTDRSVLFGTDSFWEGVDVAGDALRCVIIVKLPFKVPSEPIIQARSEAIISRGGDAFYEYSLPQAIVKFKQGVGRLIRNKRDRGCIICLDSRLLQKNYGKLFLNSLPPCPRIFDTTEQIQSKMTEFYRKTHYLASRR